MTKPKKITRNICPPHKHVSIVTNRHGKQFKECDDCGAFLGWC